MAALADGDMLAMLQEVQRFCHERTRILIEKESVLWFPVLRLARMVGVCRSSASSDRISRADLENFLYLGGFEVITRGQGMLMPFYIPVVSWVCNALFSHVSFIRWFCLQQWLIARPIARTGNRTQVTVSVIVPCKNEQGNIESIVQRCPTMGASTEIIFVEGGSHDGTAQEVERVIDAYPEKNIKLLVQEGIGKGDAVRKGFSYATGDMLMILDADLAVDPEVLPSFFHVLVGGKAEFVNGSRLVYAMEPGAMRFLNFLANIFLVQYFPGSRGSA
jgi:hypothetical protein